VRGYLAHIAAKVTGTSPVVRPRVPSLFEPVKGAQILSVPNIVNPRPEVAQEPASFEQDRFVDAVAHPSTRSQPESAQRPKPNNADVRPKDAEPPRALAQLTEWMRGEERPRPIEARTFQPQIAPVSEAQRSQTNTRREAVQQQATPISIQRETPEQIHARIEAPVPRSESFTTRVEQVEREVVRTVRDRDESQRPDKGIMPASRRDSTPLETAPAVVSPIAHVNHQPVSERLAPAREIVSEGPPSVQVTIGRLIVEAVMPPAAPAPVPMRQTPGPRLSLDDYLRQRGGRA
jgi:hypothetical protein